jgi:hypothetical protein
VISLASQIIAEEEEKMIMIDGKCKIPMNPVLKV